MCGKDTYVELAGGKDGEAGILDEVHNVIRRTGRHSVWLNHGVSLFDPGGQLHRIDKFLERHLGRKLDEGESSMSEAKRGPLLELSRLWEISSRQLWT